MLKAGQPSRERAFVRLVFGQTQMAGATIGLCLLLRTSVNRWTAGVMVATGVVTLVSRILFQP